jgi:hypothetical protein
MLGPLFAKVETHCFLDVGVSPEGCVVITELTDLESRWNVTISFSKTGSDPIEMVQYYSTRDGEREEWRAAVLRTLGNWVDMCPRGHEVFGFAVITVQPRLQEEDS